MRQVLTLFARRGFSFMKTSTLGEIEQDSRGWEYIAFKDRYDHPCSLRVSSLADYAEPGTSALWIGSDDARPQVMAREAHLVLVKTEDKVGWVPYPIPDNVSLRTRAHLSREQVEALIGHLERWLETGSIK